MATPFSAKTSDWFVVGYGQSLIQSDANVADSLMYYIMQGRGVPSVSRAIGGKAWVQLRDWSTWRLDPVLNNAPNVVLIMVGGTTDYTLGVTGANVQVYEREVATEAQATNTGNLYIINTTTTPSTAITGGAETERVAGNALVLADDQSAYFNYVVDLAGDPDLDDPTNTTYYSDGTHPTDAGRQIMANLINAKLDLILP